MAFFDNLGKTISEKGKEAAHKAKVLTETVQLRGQISTEESTIQSVFQEIGRQVYEQTTETDKQRFAEQLEKIQAAKTRIAELEAEINSAEGVQLCPQCGAKMPVDAAFCNNCGAKQEKPMQVVDTVAEIEDQVIVAGEPEAAIENMEEAEPAVCASCGNPLESGSNFCMVCGAKIS